MGWAPAYVTSDELKGFIRDDDDLDDVEVNLAIEAASRAVDTFTGRQFGKTDTLEERRYTPRRRGGRWVVDIDDLMSTTGLTVAVPAGPVAYDLEPVNAAADGRPWTRMGINSVLPTGARSEVTVTATWGWTDVPTAVQQAVMLQASRFVARRESPYGIAGSPSDGSELRLLARVDPDVAVILAPYRRVQWAVG